MQAVRIPTMLVASSLTTATPPTVMSELMKTVGSVALAKISCATVAPDQPWTLTTFGGLTVAMPYRGSPTASPTVTIAALAS